LTKEVTMTIRSTRLSTKLGIGAAVLGLGVSAAGIAGAATTDSSNTTPNSHHTAAHERGHRAELIAAIAESGSLPAKFNCANAATWQSKISSAEEKLTGDLISATSKQQSASTAGETLKAQVIADRITKMTQLRSDLVTVSGLITTQCG